MLMEKAVETIRFWAYPAAVILLWVLVAASSLSHLGTMNSSLTSPAAVQRWPQVHAPQGCVDVC
jgi:hypothetical protein